MLDTNKISECYSIWKNISAKNVNNYNIQRCIIFFNLINDGQTFTGDDKIKTQVFIINAENVKKRKLRRNENKRKQKTRIIHFYLSVVVYR